MNIFVNVRNRVAARPTLPGIAVSGMVKVMADINTMAITGKNDFNKKLRINYNYFQRGRQNRFFYSKLIKITFDIKQKRKRVYAINLHTNIWQKVSRSKMSMVVLMKINKKHQQTWWTNPKIITAMKAPVLSNNRHGNSNRRSDLLRGMRRKGAQVHHHARTPTMRAKSTGSYASQAQWAHYTFQQQFASHASTPLSTQWQLFSIRRW